MNKRIPALLAILIILLVIFAIIIVAFLLYPKEDETGGTELDMVSTTTRTETDYDQGTSTENWQIYKNEEYGFMIKYPADWEKSDILWEKSEPLFNISLLEPKPDPDKKFFWRGSFRIMILPNPNQLNLEEWMKGYKREAATGANLIQGITDTILDGKIAKRVSVFGFDHTEIVLIIINNGIIYNLSFEDAELNDPDNSWHQQIYEQMLSTFRLIEPIETCVDSCGNGICEEVVCLAIGCSCSETKESCPQDCDTKTEIKTPQLEIKNFTTDKKTYTSNEELKASLTVLSLGEAKGAIIKLTGIKPYNYAYINSSQTVDLDSGENKIIFTATTPHCTAGCGGVYPGPYDLNVEVFIEENLVASSTISINLTNE